MATDDVDPPAGAGGGTETADLDDLSRKLIGWYNQDLPHVLKWRKSAREAYEFYSGDQWSDADKRVLEGQNRPAMTFNRIAPLVNAVTGSEINNRREVQYIPREQGDAQANEILTSAGEWFRDQTNAEDEESDMFEDSVIAGMGWSDTRLDFEEEPDGAPKITRLDPLKMGWDCDAIKPNLEDARRLWYVDKKPLSEWKEMFPGVPDEMFGASWADDGENDKGEPHDQQEANFYNGGQNEYAGDLGDKRLCTVVEFRWIEKVPYFRGPDLQTGQLREYDEKQVAILKKDNPHFPAVRQYKKVVKRAFVGRQVLADPDQPLVPPGLFGWECVTGYRDKINKQFYGVVRVAIDPQRWSNKFFSQVMYLLNSQSKGGIMAERGAFENDRDAEESWAKADSITYTAKGALAAQKIQPKPVAQFPTGFFTLFQESKEAISQVTGLSQEFIGTREVDQAGVLEHQRRQSSLNLLASLFNSLRRYRKRQGLVMLYLIQNYLSDGRLVRIVGQDRKQYVPLTKDAVASSKYDIVIDDAPTSPNEKERTWQILQMLLPLLKGVIPPEQAGPFALEMLPYTPLPASLVDKMKQMSQEAAQAPKPPSPEEQKMALEQQKAQIDMAGKQTDLQVHQAKAQVDMQKSSIDLFIAQQQAQNDLAVSQQKLELQAQQNALKAESNRIAAQNANSNRVKAASGQ